MRAQPTLVADLTTHHEVMDPVWHVWRQVIHISHDPTPAEPWRVVHMTTQPVEHPMMPGEIVTARLHA
jgi:hypothetical protein